MYRRLGPVALAGCLLLAAPAASRAAAGTLPQVHLKLVDIGAANAPPIKVSVVATSPPYLTDQSPTASTFTAPAGRRFLAMNATLTNNSTHPFDLTGFNDLALQKGFDGEFDIPSALYASAFGTEDQGKNGFKPIPSPAYSCHLTDQPITGDCEIGFRAEYFGSQPILAPGAAAPVTLRTDILTGDDQYATVPAAFDVGAVRAFLRDPRDETRENLVPCSDPHHPPTSFLNYLLYSPGSPPTYSCEPGLTLELRWPGETAVPLGPFDPDLGPTGGDCRRSGENSESHSAITLASVRSGTTTDIEESDRAVHSWWVAARTDRFAGVQFDAPGAKLGDLGLDVEVIGGFTFGTQTDMRFATQDQADEVVRLFKDGFESDPAQATAATNLATSAVATSYTSSGVDLDGSFGGAAGNITASAARARGVIRYRTGDHGVFSTLTLKGGLGSGTGAFGLDGQGVRTMELDLSNQDAPVALKTTTDLDLAGQILQGNLTGKATSVIDGIQRGEAKAGFALQGGFTLSYQQEVLLDPSPTTPDGKTVESAAQALVAELDQDPGRLPADAGDVADRLGPFENDYVIVSKAGTTRGGIPVTFSDGLSWGLDYGESATSEEALAASLRMPHGDFQAWKECVA